MAGVCLFSITYSLSQCLVRWMTFCPEWLTGSPNLDTSNPLYLWVYLFVCSVNHLMSLLPRLRLHLLYHAVHEYHVSRFFSHAY